MPQIDNRAKSQWLKARTPYQYLRDHIANKDPSDRCKLSLYDLLLVKNFKGGSATIAEPIHSLSAKLNEYEKMLTKINEKFHVKNHHLKVLNKTELQCLIDLTGKFCELSSYPKSKINGFGPSFASALLHAFFPDLIPILDRRALNGAEIADVFTNSQGQVKHIESHYPRLIKYFFERTQTQANLTIEEIDKQLFEVSLAEKFRKAPKSN